MTWQSTLPLFTEDLLFPFCIPLKSKRQNFVFMYLQ